MQVLIIVRLAVIYSSNNSCNILMRGRGRGMESSRVERGEEKKRERGDRQTNRYRER